MTRLQALARILAAFPTEPVVAACGATARELASLGVQPRCLYLQNSMGLVGPVALGLALGLPDARRVVAIEGDGGALMGLSQLGTLALLRPPALVIALLDNGVHASTGGQPTAATALDLGALFATAGCRLARAADEPDLAAALAAATETPGPWCIHVRIEPTNANVPYFQADPALLGARFSAYVQGRV